MATIEQLSSALVKADAAGNAEDAKALADAIRQMQAAPVEAPAAPKQAGFLTQLGRGAASLADVTIGGVIPAIAQQVAYPIARLGRSPEQAQAATARVVGAVEQPFGKAFGVSNTPEYQQEAGRQVLDVIGQNFQKGAKWIADKTGIPQSDVENYLGTASLAAPLAKPIPGAIKQAVAPVVERATVAAKMPFEKQIQARRERLSAEDYARGPQIDAAADAQRLGIALNPVDIEPSAGSRLTSAVAGEKGVQAITDANKNQVRKVVLTELNLPPTTQLNGGAAFKQARADLSAPYDEVRKLPIQQADDAMVQRLENIRTDLDIIGAKDYAPAISKIVDDAIAKTQTGLTGETLLKNISVLRERARKTYNNKAATTEALDIADTNLKVAAELESMIDNSISNPKLLSQYRDARQKMAKTYAYEGATDFNTGIVDVGKLARITAKDNAMTGDIAALGRIAGNFPEAFTTKAASPWTKAISVGRTGAAGTLGGVAGYALGQDYLSAAAGSVLGALGGKIGESVAANRLASPAYQAGLNLRDARIPVNQLANATTQQAPQNALIPVGPEVLDPSGQPAAPRLRIVDYDVNGNPIYAPMRSDRAPNSPDFTTPNQPTFGNRPTVFESQRGLPNEVPRQIYEAQKRAEMAQEFRARDERKPASGGQVIDIDPVTGKMTTGAENLAGMTPNTQVIESTGKSLSSAADKITAGKMFDMTLAEKAAWKNTRADLAEVVPSMKGLDDKAIVAKMQNRAWVEDAIAKAREKAAMFDELSKRIAGDQAKRDAAIKREQMLDLLANLEDQFSKARPAKKSEQGPKTRAAQRNMLIPEERRIILNNMLPDQP
jgi:hypothetical protein